MGRQAIALRKGDAVFHQYDLLHGVEVHDIAGATSTRWSWILWFKDSTTCVQHGHEWSRQCAEAGDPMCQYTYGWRLHLNPLLTDQEKNDGRTYWMRESANGGFGEAMFKVHTRTCLCL